MLNKIIDKIIKKRVGLGVILCIGAGLSSSLSVHIRASYSMGHSLLDSQELSDELVQEPMSEKDTAKIIAMAIQIADADRQTPLTPEQKEGMARLLDAQLRNDMPAVRAAISDGAGIYMRGIEQEATLLLTIMSGNKEIVLFLLDQERIKRDWLDSDQKIMMLCMCALGWRQPDIAELFMGYINDVNTSINGVTLLMMVAGTDYTTIIELLLNKGAVVDAYNNQNQTALYCAADAGKSDSVKILLAHGADINGNPDHSETIESRNNPLQVAAQNNHGKVVKLLVLAGAQTDRVLENLTIVQKSKPSIKNMITLIKKTLKEQQDARDKEWLAQAGTFARWRYSAWRAIKNVVGY